MKSEQQRICLGAVTILVAITWDSHLNTSRTWWFCSENKCERTHRGFCFSELEFFFLTASWYICHQQPGIFKCSVAHSYWFSVQVLRKCLTMLGGPKVGRWDEIWHNIMSCMCLVCILTVMCKTDRLMSKVLFPIFIFTKCFFKVYVFKWCFAQWDGSIMCWPEVRREW